MQLVSRRQTSKRRHSGANIYAMLGHVICSTRLRRCRLCRRVLVGFRSCPRPIRLAGNRFGVGGSGRAEYTAGIRRAPRNRLSLRRPPFSYASGLGSCCRGSAGGSLLRLLSPCSLCRYFSLTRRFWCMPWPFYRALRRRQKTAFKISGV